MADEQAGVYGYDGRILHLDLTTGRSWVETPGETFYRTYMGGAALIGYYLLRKVPAHADPLGPENRLIFTSGLLTGVPISGAGRSGAGAKSPLSRGYGKAEIGGYWGAELKFAGWDAVIIEGQASEPVYLSIVDDRVEIHDAGHLWGKEVLETEQAVKAELGDPRVRVAAIGPGGERMVRYACTMSDTRSAAGRMGLGAVMGAKKLKAFAVRGHSRVALADRGAVVSLAKTIAARLPVESKRMMEHGTGGHVSGDVLTGNLPIRNFGDGALENVENIEGVRLLDLGYRVRMDTCYACAMRCKKVVQSGEPWNVIPE